MKRSKIKNKIEENNNRIDNLGFKNCEDLNPFLYISIFINIIFEILIIYSLYKLKENKYLKEWFIFALLLNLSLILTYIVSNNKCYNKFLSSIRNPLFTIINIINLIMLIRLFLYIRTIDKKQLNEKIIYWYLIILFAFMMFLIIYIITLLYIFGI
jgi:fumarate reductase subunit C